MHSSLRLLALAALASSLLFAALPARAQTESVLFSFTGANGEIPGSTLIFDSAGNLYGTTEAGGDINSTTCVGSSSKGCGTFFKLGRDHTGTWKETVLHQFESGRGGFYPVGPVIQDTAGNLYGTTRYGGLANGCGGGGCGVVYKLSQSAGVWRETVLHTFSGPDGEFPLSGVIMDASGNLYGTASQGGNTDCVNLSDPSCGVVFELTPLPGGGWKETVLSAFTGGADGGVPGDGGLIFDSAGNLYGTTSLYGGSNFGTVFELSPSSSGWTLTTLHTFAGATTDGAYPAGTLIFDSAGNLYGTTYQGGSGGGIGSGTVFELSPSSGSWTETVLHNFSLNPDGGEPIAGVVFDAKGNLWGTTSGGGPDGHFSTGVVFELEPGSGGTWTYVGVHDFRQGVGDGQYPYGGVVFDKSGNAYGTTAFGGSGNLGAFYKIVP